MARGANEALSEAVKEPERFVSLVFKNKARVSKALLKGLLSKSSAAGSALIAEGVGKCVVEGLESLDGVPAEENVDGFGTPPRRKRKRQGGAEEKVPSRRKQVMAGLRNCVTLIQVGLAQCRRSFQPSGLLPVVRSLHDKLVLLEEDPELQDSIAELCEVWWREGFPEKELLIAQTLPFLMSRALTSNRKVDIHRVNTMKEAFTLFDFVDVSIEDLKHLLIRAVVTPSFLRAAEGRRFVSFLFGLSPQLVKELNALMHSQIPFGRKSILEAYGEILYRAWKATTGACLAEIESSCIQGLIEGAVYASTKTLGSACRKVLEGFITQRADADVEAMLFRLQEPILFRSLQVANSNVRRNAVLLLVDLFPLQDPEACKEDKELLFEKQFVLIDKLLQDPCPDVRSTMTEGACRVLRLFWEVIPATITAKLLTKIVDDMAKDQSSNSTRLAVLEGVTYLLENSRSHEILKVLLPRLAPMLNDPAVAVRVAAVDLLLAIRGIRGIAFHKVARLDSLLSLLADDCEVVARRLTSLLIPSYFPTKSEVSEACNRCCTLIKRSPSAGARFCSLLLAEGVLADSAFELLQFLCGLASSGTDLDDDHREGVFLALSELGLSLTSSVPWRHTVGEYLTGKLLVSLLKAAATPQSRTAVIKLASSLPPKDVPELTKYCGDLVMASAKDLTSLESSHEIRAVNSFVLAWGGFDDFVQALLDLFAGFHKATTTAGNLQSTVKKKMKQGRARTRSSPRRQRDLDNWLTLAIGAAWHVQNLLAESDTRRALLSCRAMQELLAHLKYLAEYSMKNIRMIADQGVISAAVTAYAHLTMHLTLERKKDGNIRTSTGRKKRHRVDVTPISNPLQDGTEETLHELIDWTVDMIEDLHGEPESSKTRSSQGECTMLPRAIKLASATLRSVLEALNLGLASDGGSLYSKAVHLAIKFVTAVRTCIDGENLLEDLSPCLKAAASYVGKLLSVCTIDGSASSSECAALAHSLLDTASVIEQQEAGSCYQVLPGFRPWLADILTAVADNLVPQEGAPSTIWLSCITSASVQVEEDHHEGEASTSRDCENIGGSDLTQVILKTLVKLNKQVLQVFVGQLLTHTTACFKNEEHDGGIGSLYLLCKCLAQRKRDIKLQEAAIAELRRIESSVVSSIDFLDERKLKTLRNLVKEVTGQSLQPG